MKDFKEKLNQFDMEVIIKKMVDDEKINPKKLKYDIFLRTKEYPMCEFKHISIYWILNHTQNYYGILTQVGKAFHRTHVTTIYANKITRERILQKDKDFMEKVRYFNDVLLEKI